MIVGFARISMKTLFPLSILSGVLLGIGFVIPSLWFISLFGLVPFLFGVQREQPNATQAFLHGLLIWFILQGSALHAIFWHTLPVDWYGISSWWVQILVVFGSWMLAVAILALGVGLFGGVQRWVKTDSMFDVLIIPALWVLCEILSSLVFSVITIGPGSLVGAHFTLGYLGYLLANDLVLLQTAWFGGVYFLSFVVIAVNVLLYRLFITKGRERVLLYVLSAILIVLYVFSNGIFTRSSHEYDGMYLDIAAVSTYAVPKLHLTDEEERERSAHIFSLIHGISLSKADVVVLPESATFFRNLSGEMFPEDPRLIIDSNTIVTAEGSNHSHAIFRYSKIPPQETDKQLMLPLGEYMPYLYRGLLLFASREFRAQVLDTRAYVQGEGSILARVSEVPMSVRFCNEVMSPYLYTRDVRKGAKVLINLSSHSWFHGSHAVYQQMQNIAKVRSVESGKWYVQSGNMVPAFMLDSLGRVIGETTWGTPQVLSMQVPMREEETPYTRFGAWVPLILAGILLGALGKHIVINRELY